MLRNEQVNAPANQPSAEQIAAGTKILHFWRSHKARQSQNAESNQAHDHVHVVHIQMSQLDAMMFALLPPQLQQMALLSMILEAGHGHSHSHSHGHEHGHVNNDASAPSNNMNNNDDSDDDSHVSMDSPRAPTPRPF